MTFVALVIPFLCLVFAADIYMVARACDGKISNQYLDDVPALKPILYAGAILGVPLYRIGQGIYWIGLQAYIWLQSQRGSREASKYLKSEAARDK